MKSLKQVWAAAQHFLTVHKEKAVSEQDAKHPTIETGLILQNQILAA